MIPELIDAELEQISRDIRYHFEEGRKNHGEAVEHLVAVAKDLTAARKLIGRGPDFLRWVLAEHGFSRRQVFRYFTLLRLHRKGGRLLSGRRLWVLLDSPNAAEVNLRPQVKENKGETPETVPSAGTISLELDETTGTYTRRLDDSGGQMVDTTCEQVDDEPAADAHVSRNTGESEWYTPVEIVERARAVLGDIDLDPASHPDAQEVIRAERFFTAKENGLEQPWEGRVWMNPPYSQPLVGQFCEKLVREFRGGKIRAAMTLTNNATETDWAQGLLEQAAAVCFPNGRVKFWAPGRVATPLQGQMLCYFGVHPERFMAVFEDLGICLEPMGGR